MRIVTLVNLGDLYNRRVLQGVAQFAHRQAWDLDVVNLLDRSQIAGAMAGADGLLLGIHRFEEHPLLTGTQLPAVSWSGSLAEVNWRRVGNDDLTIGQAAAEHLLARGFRRFAFYNDVQDAWALRRRDGFLGRLRADELSAASLTQPAAGNGVLARQLRKLRGPLGVMVAHDQSAIRFMSACRQAGLSIPGEIAIVGVNNDDIATTICSPALTTIPLQTRRIGYESAALLAQALARAPRAPWSVLVPPGDIIVRQSSDTLATGDPLVIQAVDFIRRELANGIGTKEVAATMQVSRTTLDMRFQQAIGRTAAAEIRHQRLGIARKLLANTRLRMPEVARRAGFSSARQLSESFQRFARQSPTAYRAHLSQLPGCAALHERSRSHRAAARSCCSGLRPL